MKNWRQIQKKTLKNLDDICAYLELSPEKKKRLIQRKGFHLFVPLRIAQKIPKNCLDNPLALQFLPLDLEKSHEGKLDPVGDKNSMKSPSLLHKYEGRALFLVTGACAMHCRYCFRQNFPYESQIEESVELIKKDPSIKEVILSGGDPLSLSDKNLETILEALELIKHVKIIRFHTRFLVGIPERISEDFLKLLEKSSKQIVFVVHVNCKEELDDDIFKALSKIQSLKIPILSQSVLLKGVNDSKDKLYDLFWALAQRGVIPYYLHQLDRVKGALHFEVSKEKGLRLISELRNSLPGYAVPRFVEEIKGDPSKRLICGNLEKE